MRLLSHHPRDHKCPRHRRPAAHRNCEPTYLAGRVTNTPADMIRWIQHPQKIEPGTAMPEMGVTDSDARDIAAYLYTLR